MTSSVIIKSMNTLVLWAAVHEDVHHITVRQWIMAWPKKPGHCGLRSSCLRLMVDFIHLHTVTT